MATSVEMKFEVSLEAPQSVQIRPGWTITASALEERGLLIKEEITYTNEAGDLVASPPREYPLLPPLPDPKNPEFESEVHFITTDTLSDGSTVIYTFERTPKKAILVR